MLGRLSGTCPLYIAWNTEEGALVSGHMTCRHCYVVNNLVSPAWDFIVTSCGGKNLVQVKKPEIREAILEAAAAVFEEENYHNSTISKIAAAAGVPTSSIYIYFRSKTEIAIAVYEPWLQERLVQLEHDLEKLDDPRARVSLILKRIWQEIPSQQNCIANNIIQAISTSDLDSGYRPNILMMARSRISSMIYSSLPSYKRSHDRCDRWALLIFMAFDGFIINQHSHHFSCDEETINLVCDAVLQTTKTR